MICTPCPLHACVWEDSAWLGNAVWIPGLPAVQVVGRSGTPCSAATARRVLVPALRSGTACSTHSDNPIAKRTSRGPVRCADQPDRLPGCDHHSPGRAPSGSHVRGVCLGHGAGLRCMGSCHRERACRGPIPGSHPCGPLPPMHELGGGGGEGEGRGGRWRDPHSWQRPAPIAAGSPTPPTPPASQKPGHRRPTGSSTGWTRPRPAPRHRRLDANGKVYHARVATLADRIPFRLCQALLRPVKNA